MGRSKIIDDKTLLDLIQKYYIEDCKGNANKLKLPALTEYIINNGYPNYTVTTLRRNEKARQYIDSLKQSTEEKSLAVLSTYKTLDVEAFLNTNKTHLSLKKALTELDLYYKTVAESATEVSKKYSSLEKRYTQVSEELTTIKQQNEEMEQAIKQLKEEIKTLQASNKQLKTVVNDYVYDDIANELLAQAGELVKEETIIDTNKLNKQIITAETKISKKSNSGSSVIQGIFDNFEE